MFLGKLSKKKKQNKTKNTSVFSYYSTSFLNEFDNHCNSQFSKLAEVQNISSPDMACTQAIIKDVVSS